MNLDIRLKEFIKQKGKRLLLPYYITGAIICILLIFANAIRGLESEIFPNLKRTIGAIAYGTCSGVADNIEGIGILWFLWALFWAVIIVKIFYRFKYSFIYIPVLGIFSYISSEYFWLPLSIQPGLCAAGFVYLGVRLKEIDLIKILKNKRLAFFSIITLIVEINIGIYVGMSDNIYRYGFLSVIGSILISNLVVFISYKLNESSKLIKTILSVYGKNSLYILCLHKIEMSVFPWSVVLYLLEKMGVAAHFEYVVLLLRIIGLGVCSMLISKGLIWLKSEKRSL